MNYYSQVNLLALDGAQYDKEKGTITIPMKENGIKERYNTQTGMITGAMLSLRYKETNDKYKAACMANNRYGDYQPPTHTIELSLSKDARQARQQRAMNELLADHPEWNAYDPLDYRNPLGDAVIRKVNKRVGDMYESKTREQ